GDLHRCLKEKGAPSPATAVNFALDIRGGMAYLHNEPNVIVHRDLNRVCLFIHRHIHNTKLVVFLNV
nr:integrin-linked protein kinase 1 [Tanacetum cinerariifolium]